MAELGFACVWCVLLSRYVTQVQKLGGNRAKLFGMLPNIIEEAVFLTLAAVAAALGLWRGGEDGEARAFDPRVDGTPRLLDGGQGDLQIGNEFIIVQTTKSGAEQALLATGKTKFWRVVDEQ